MAYDVTIKYTPVEPEQANHIPQICPVFIPENSYVDTDVYVEGHEEDYGKSVYATNVPGFGELDMPQPYDFTYIPMSSPLAQFRLETVLEDGGDLETGVTFEVDDYKEAFYYKTLGEQMKEQGFTVEVKKK